MQEIPNTEPTVVLASSSPRRKALLAEAGVRFQSVEPEYDEPAQRCPALSARQYAEAAAYFKAKSVADSPAMAGKCVLGADTVVALGDEMLGKAADADDARRMLRELSSHPHSVITGVALLRGDERLIASDTTQVRMRAMTADEIEQYVASGEWIDKAGAYAIQETADRFVVGIEGSFSNVVGLPVELVRRMLTEMDRVT
ncbi:MAG: Maf family protein [Planctomycetota bacterium]|jgi:septum formation protein